MSLLKTPRAIPLLDGSVNGLNRWLFFLKQEGAYYLNGGSVKKRRIELWPQKKEKLRWFH